MAGRLKVFSLLAEFTDDDREALADVVEERVLRAGRRVFSEGTEAEGLVLVESGTVRIESRRTGESEGVEAPVALGAMSLVAVGPRECTVFAETECRVLLLPRTAFRRLVDDAPRTACRLMEGIVDDAAGSIRGALDSLASV
jgi:CRP-like cAMP-binding protein